MMARFIISVLIALQVLMMTVSSFQSFSSPLLKHQQPRRRETTKSFPLRSTTEEDAASKSSSPTSAKKPIPPMLNGQKVIPMRVLMPALAQQDGGEPFSAVYAVLTSGYTAATNSIIDNDDPDAKEEAAWSKVKFVGTTRDLYQALLDHMEDQGSDKVAHVRAQAGLDWDEAAAQEMVVEWKSKAFASGAKLADDWMTPEILQRKLSALRAAGGDGSDDRGVVESPFSSQQQSEHVTPKKNLLSLNTETVNQVLDTIRPYLIKDGGNVSVQQVDPSAKQITLKLEGACGSCASSTVTMSLGIEKTLRESFGNDIKIIQLQPQLEEDSTLTLEAVQEEMNRMDAAMKALGAVLKIDRIDPITGEVTIRFNGPDRVKKGLELALLENIPQCSHVTFLSSL